MNSTKPIIGAIWDPIKAALPPSRCQIRNENCPSHIKANASGALVNPEIPLSASSSFLTIKKIIQLNKPRFAMVKSQLKEYTEANPTGSIISKSPKTQMTATMDHSVISTRLYFFGFWDLSERK